MGVFTGYLIASDIDGTFVGKSGEISKNAEAIKYFTENGGRFTFATGRLISHLREKGFLELINAPACLSNGSVVYDYENEKAVSEEPLPYTFSEYIAAVRDYLFEGATFSAVMNIAASESDKEVASKENAEPPTPELVVITGCLEEIDRQIAESREIANARMLKIVVRHKAAEDAVSFRKAVKELPFFSETHISRSWPIGVEFNSIKGTKGAALKIIKQALPDVHTAIGIGDYENDLTLLECADIGVAVEGAVPELLKIASFTVCAADDFAIACLIRRLEETIKSK